MTPEQARPTEAVRICSTASTVPSLNISLYAGKNPTYEKFYFITCEFPQIFSEIIKFLYNLNYKMQVKIEVTTPCGYRDMSF